MLKKVMLIGGSKNRQTMEIERWQHEIRIAKPCQIQVIELGITPIYEAIKYETYHQQHLQIGSFELSNLFFLEGINPSRWLLQIVLDDLKFIGQ
jgi:hypothetical protein